MACKNSDFNWKEQMMKEMNPLEARLRSWQPRRPSPRLRHRIFLAPSRTPAQTLFQSLRCLAPAAACLLLALGAFSQGGAVSGGVTHQELLTGMIGSNRVPYLPADYQQEYNRLARVTFGWTNSSDSTSSITSFGRAQ
jgi:hypothetical protein